MFENPVAGGFSTILATSPADLDHLIDTSQFECTQHIDWRTPSGASSAGRGTTADGRRGTDSFVQQIHDFDSRSLNLSGKE